MPHSFGYRARTRYMFARKFREHGAIPLSTYMKVYKVGDIVDVKGNGAIQKGLPHKFYHGKTGVVYNVTKSAVGVIVHKRVGNRYLEKRINVRIEHVRHSKCREDFLRRVKENAAAAKAASESGNRVILKRLPAQPREARFVSTKNNEPTTITAIPYDNDRRTNERSIMSTDRGISENTQPGAMRDAQAANKHVPAAVERHVGPWLHFVAGGLAGMTGAIITSPLDVLRTRQQLYGTTFGKQGQIQAIQQAQPSAILRTLRPFIATGSYLKELCVKEGFRGWFAGLGPALAGIIPSRSIQFFAYGNGKNVLTYWNSGQETALIHLSAAAIAAMITTTATSPIWMVKTRMQVQPGKYENSLACLYSIIKKEGLIGLYKGTSAAYIGASESAIQWVIYEQLKYMIRSSSSSTTLSSTPARSKTITDWFEYFGAAATAKLLASVITYPHEVLRTRLRQPPDEKGMVKYRGLINTTKIIYKEEGVRGFYGGLTPHLLRTVPNAAIMFLSYELVLYYFGSSKTLSKR
ncbi:Pyrimidine nucleotide transporter, mitochondrial [Coemansia spiralis]|uniref:Pyrimidine nucleotide transporter, mitochondrial n=1 Tax=Coemansia spiralis TaxID=417178 RepID=A0A9W8KZ68_9FUNG|nr:Pyrimidine nucleotide transporter, mitochondrial [Coemansia spiralis]